jgi:beta-phosphoglucomutase family hydrolase
MIKAIIFDLDGTIADTEKLHSKVGSDLLNEYGVKISPAKLHKIHSGMKTEEIFGTYIKNPIIVNLMLKEKWIRALKYFDDEGVKPLPGAIQLINQFHKRGLKLAIATSSIRESAIKILKRLKVLDKFKVIVSADDVKKGKPNPEMFLLAAKKLNVKPEECIVIEDANNGMKAAKNARMLCIGLKPYANKSKADFVVKTLKEVNIDKVINAK